MRGPGAADARVSDRAVCHLQAIGPIAVGLAGSAELMDQFKGQHAVSP
jgi:hypothetical protein